MVKTLKQRFSNIDATFLFAVVFTILLSVGVTWLMISYLFREIIQGILYPYSNYPVIISSTADILMIPGSIVLWLGSFIGVLDILSKLFKKPIYEKVKMKLGQAIGVMLVVSLVTLIANYVTWQIAARANGYTQCTSGSKLLVGSKTSSVWSKEEYLCYDYNVDKLLPTGTHEQVLEVAEYLKKD
ncbi:hypothetical protein [Pseudoalteromonas sp. C12FD-1]|uniref:hypothetical protein n=1 Tax=Pseudoalteromonas sp. C12FD-1 TaxID=3131979 RepID=UPI00307D5F8B